MKNCSSYENKNQGHEKEKCRIIWTSGALYRSSRTRIFKLLHCVTNLLGGSVLPVSQGESISPTYNLVHFRIHDLFLEQGEQQKRKSLGKNITTI